MVINSNMRMVDTRNCISSSAMSYFAAFMAPCSFSSSIDDESGYVRFRTITATCVSLGECQKDIPSHPGSNARKVFADDKTDSEM